MSKVPNVVASLSLEAQTADVSQAIFTPSTSGLFRLSLYLESDITTGQGSGTVHLTWTDNAELRDLTIPDSETGLKVFNSILKLTSGNPLSISTTMDAAINFNLYAIVEALD